MAYQQNFNDDEEEQGPGEGGSSGSEQVLSSGSSQLGQGGSQSGGGGQSGSSKPTSSGSWTNLMDYVSANKGNDAQMGEKVETGIGNRASDATSSANQYKSSADQGIEAGTVRDQGIVNEVSSNAKGITQDQAKRAQFDKQWDAYYGGPKDATNIEGYQDTTQKYNKVDERAKNAQTHTGRMDLLKDEYSRPTYTRGENTLDSFILGAGDQGRQKLNDINQQYSNYSQNWQNVLGQVNQGMQDAEATTNKTREDTRGAVNTGIANREQQFADYTKELEAANAKKNQNYANLTSGLKAGTADAEIGLDSSVGDFLRRNNFNMQSLVKGVDDRRLGDMASEDQISDYQALLDLGRKEAGNYQDFSKSGVVDGDYYARNQGMYDSAKGAYDKYAELQRKLDMANAERNSAYRTVRDGFASQASLAGSPVTNNQINEALKYTGLTRAQYDDAQRKGIQLNNYLTENRKLALGDVANDADRNTWNQLMSVLGNGGFNAFNLNDAGEDGKGFNFRTDKFLEDLEKAYQPGVTTQSSGTLTSSGNNVVPQQLNPINEPVTNQIVTTGKKWRGK